MGSESFSIVVTLAYSSLRMLYFLSDLLTDSLGGCWEQKVSHFFMT